MSPAQQAAFSAAAQEAIRWNDEQVLANERDALEYYLKSESGLQVMWPNLTAFQVRAKKILLESPSKAFRDLHRQVRALLREEAVRDGL